MARMLDTRFGLQTSATCERVLSLDCWFVLGLSNQFVGQVGAGAATEHFLLLNVFSTYRFCEPNGGGCCTTARFFNRPIL
jgi:hypothetical protein